MKKRKNSNEEKNNKKAKLNNSEIITLNVGGTLFTTTETTLSSAGGYFSKLFDEHYGEPLRGKDGHIYIDKNPEYFGIILGYLRSGTYLNIYKIEDMEFLNSEIDWYGLSIPKVIVIMSRFGVKGSFKRSVLEYMGIVCNRECSVAEHYKQWCSCPNKRVIHNALTKYGFKEISIQETRYYMKRIPENKK